MNETLFFTYLVIIAKGWLLWDMNWQTMIFSERYFDVPMTKHGFPVMLGVSFVQAIGTMIVSYILFVILP